MYLRVFALSETQPDPDALVDSLRAEGFEVVGNFRVDDQGWIDGQLLLADMLFHLPIERFLVEEEGIRRQLNTWAAWVETVESEHQTRLMQHLVSTRQLFTIGIVTPGWIAVAQAAGRYLARAVDGVYQVDNLGFFDSDGTLLVAEEEDDEP